MDAFDRPKGKGDTMRAWTLEHRRLIAGIVGLATTVAVAAIGAVVLAVGEAGATAPAALRPLDESAIPEGLRSGLTEIVSRIGIETAGLQEVAGGNSDASRSGLVVGLDSRGGEYAAFYSPGSFTEFSPVEEAPKPVYVWTSAQPASPGGATAHVEIAGISAPNVSSVTIQLSDGSSLDAELVALSRSGFRFFTYQGDTPAAFPIAVRALRADGAELAVRDLSSSIAPPQS